TFVRRFLVLAALMFWQGGFTFYASIVVPVGQQVFREHLGSPLGQGFITREVTSYLNLSGAVALALFAWDLLAVKDPSRLRSLGRWSSWAVLLLLLVLLFVFHQMLDRQL